MSSRSKVPAAFPVEACPVIAPSLLISDEVDVPGGDCTEPIVVDAGGRSGDRFERRPWVTRVLSFVLLWFAVITLPGLASVAMAQAPGLQVAAAKPKLGAQKVDAVEAELVADVSRAAPGEPFRIALRLRHDANWHTYWRNPGDSGLPTIFVPTGPDGATYADIVWPVPKRLAIGDLANYGYEGEVLLSREVTLPASFTESNARFEVLAQWLVCKEICIPGEAALALQLPVATPAQPAGADIVARFEDNAARAPVAAVPMKAGWWQDGDLAYLVLPDGMNADRAEFFPYFEGVVTPAARQTLLALVAREGQVVKRAPTQGEVAPRFALRLAVAASQALPDSAAGVLQVEGRAIEIALQPLAQAPAVGDVVSIAEVVPSAPVVPPGLFDRLRSRVGGASVSPAGASASAVSSVGDPSFSTLTLTSTDRSGPDPVGGAAASSGRVVSGSAVSTTLGLAIAGALLGGLILNLMPCVFPVIGLKVLSFTQLARGDTRVARVHALTFSAGVVLSFVLLGIGLLALRSAGATAGWGFQMQSPLFVGAMALLFVLIGLNLFGVFEAGLSFTRLDVPVERAGVPASPMEVTAATSTRESGKTSTSRRTGLRNSFWTGVIAVLVATPCTAPFMGSAVGFTLGSSPLETLLVFAALGVGMAIPYLVLGWVPQLLRWLPRPGAWLLVFKQLLAFPMFATSAWLAWVLTLQTGAEGTLRLLTAAILLAFAAWAYGRAQAARLTGRTPRSSGTGLVGFAAAILAFAGMAWQLGQIDETLGPDSMASPAVATTSAASGVTSSSSTAIDQDSSNARSGVVSGSAQWQPWSAEKVTQALALGRPIFVDFTAAWCISCQANKKLVLERDVVGQALEAGGVVLLRADWTRRDPAITAELARFGRNGVPLYLAYTSAAEPPQLLPALLTVDTVLGAFGVSR